MERASDAEMRPYTFYTEVQERNSNGNAQGGANAWYESVPISTAIGDFLATVSVGGVTFVSTSAMIGAVTARAAAPWTVGEVILVAGGVTGAGLLLRSLAGSPRLMAWIEAATERVQEAVEDMEEEVEEHVQNWMPKYPMLDILPESDSQRIYEAAAQLWEFTYEHYKAARKNGGKLTRKPWARRHAMRELDMGQPDWEAALEIWCAGGLVKDKNAGETETSVLGRGYSMIEQGMARLGYVKLNRRWVKR